MKPDSARLPSDSAFPCQRPAALWGLLAAVLVLGQLNPSAWFLLYEDVSTFVSSLHLQHVIYALPHTEKSEPPALLDLPSSLMTPMYPPYCWPRGTPMWRLFCSCGRVLHLRAKLSFFLVPVLLQDHWDESWDKSCLCCLSLLTFHVLFACTLLLLVWAGGIALHVDSSAMIVLYCEQIALLVCAFLFPGYWSYKLIKLIPILISMAVYALQPKLLSFNYSFSSITQPVLSPLRQLHLYNSQYPRNGLPEQPLPILPFVQTLLYSFPECNHFFLCSW